EREHVDVAVQNGPADLARHRGLALQAISNETLDRPTFLRERIVETGFDDVCAREQDAALAPREPPPERFGREARRHEICSDTESAERVCRPGAHRGDLRASEGARVEAGCSKTYGECTDAVRAREDDPVVGPTVQLRDG